MLVTRQCDTGRNTWSSSKLEAINHSATSRMSNFGPLSRQPDWREEYSPFSLPGESGSLQLLFERSVTSNVSGNNQVQQQGHAKPTLEHRHSLGPLRQEPQPTPVIELPDSAPGDCSNQVRDPIRDDSLVSTESSALALASPGSNPLSSASIDLVQQGTLLNGKGEHINAEIKEEEEEDAIDDQMLEAEEGSAPQTAAERRAERRKMKRFRYDHLLLRWLQSILDLMI
jgi:hypothetical protein